MKIICDCGAEAEFFENQEEKNIGRSVFAVLIENEITMWNWQGKWHFLLGNYWNVQFGWQAFILIICNIHSMNTILPCSRIWIRFIWFI